MPATLDLMLLSYLGEGFLPKTVDVLLAGALVEDLFLTGRFAWEPEPLKGARIIVGSGAATGDPFLDGAFTAMSPRRPMAPRAMVALYGRNLVVPIRDQATEAGLLVLTRGRVAGLIPRTSWDVADPAHGMQLLGRLESGLRDSAAASASDRALLRLLAASGNLARVLTGSPEGLLDGDPVAAAVRDEIASRRIGRARATP